MDNDTERAPHGGRYVYAAESGVRLHNGMPLHFTKGEAWEATDPFVQANSGLFQDEPVAPRSTVPAGDKVERATRGPGERRGPRAR